MSNRVFGISWSSLASSEPGARETATVESGALTLYVDGAEHELQAGDTVTFDADLPHHFANHSEEEAVLLAIVSAGLRRS